MNHTSTFPALADVRASSSPEHRARLFYGAGAVVAVLLVLVGFHDFYLGGGRAYPQAREIDPAIRPLVLVHGFAMAGWILLFLAQSFLIPLGQRQLHIAMGPVALVLASCILVAGAMVNVESVRHSDPAMQLFAMTRKQFMAGGFSSLLLFAGLLGTGLWQRRRPEIHRPMMFLATLSLLDAAIGRIDAVNSLYQGTVFEILFGPSLGMLLLGAVLFVAKWCLTKRPDRWYLLGYGAVLFTSLIWIPLAKTTAWDYLASVLLRGQTHEPILLSL
jgi:hypothetical protein